MTQFYSFLDLNQVYQGMPVRRKSDFNRAMTLSLAGKSIVPHASAFTYWLRWKDYDQLGLLHISDNILSLETDEEYWGFALVDEQAEEMQKILNGNKFLDSDGVKKPGFLCSYEGQSNLLIKNAIFKKEIHREANCN